MTKFFTIVFLIIVAFATQVSAQVNTDRLIANGRNALYFEDYVLSIQYFNQVVRSKPFLAEPYFLRGIAKISLEDYSGAEQDCNLALERNPFIVKAYECRGIARLNLDKIELAIADFDKALEFSPGDKRLQLCKGVTFLQAKKYDEAIAELTSSIASEPKYLEAYVNRGHAYLGAKDTLRALADFEKAIEIDKFRPECYASKGIVLYMTGEYKKALECYDEAIRLKPERPGYYLNRALIRYNLKNLRGTMADYDQAVRLDPENHIALYNRGLLRNEVGDRNNALSDFNHVLEIDPDDDMALYNRALIEKELGEVNNAIKDINILLERHPDFYPLYYDRAEAKALKGDKRGAQLDYNQAMIMEKDMRGKKPAERESKSRKKNEKSLRNVKRLVIADREDEERRFSYKSENRGRVQNVNREIQIEPIFFISYANKSKSHYYYFNALAELNKQPLFKGKLQIINNERKLSEDEKNVLMNKTMNPNGSESVCLAQAIDYESLCAFQSALEEYNKAATLASGNWVILFNRASVRHKMIEAADENDEQQMMDLQLRLMMDDYKEVVRLCPNMYFAYFNMGNIMVEEKNYNEAISYYNIAIEKDKDFGEAYFNRGLTYIFLGENDKGIADLSKAGELGVYSAYNFIKRFTAND